MSSECFPCIVGVESYAVVSKKYLVHDDVPHVFHLAAIDCHGAAGEIPRVNLPAQTLFDAPMTDAFFRRGDLMPDEVRQDDHIEFFPAASAFFASYLGHCFITSSKG